MSTIFVIHLLSVVCRIGGNEFIVTAFRPSSHEPEHNFENWLSHFWVCNCTAGLEVQCGNRLLSFKTVTVMFKIARNCVRFEMYLVWLGCGCICRFTVSGACANECGYHNNHSFIYPSRGLAKSAIRMQLRHFVPVTLSLLYHSRCGGEYLDPKGSKWRQVGDDRTS